MTNMSDVVNNTPEGKKAVEKAVKQSIADQEAMSNTTKSVDEINIIVRRIINDTKTGVIDLLDDNGRGGLYHAIEDLTQLFTKQLEEAEIVDKWVAHLLENVYPLDVFSEETGGDHVAGIYHGMHILRREVRGLSGRDDLEFLPQETEEYYKDLRTNLTQDTKGGTDE